MLSKLIVGLSIAQSIICTPISRSQSEKRSICTGSAAAVYDESCFGELKLGNFLKEWEKKPRCGPDSDGSDCCGPPKNPQEWWSTCFLRLSTQNADYSCQQVNIGSCGLEGVVLKVPEDVRPQHRYIVRNIFGEFTFHEIMSRRDAKRVVSLTQGASNQQIVHQLVSSHQTRLDVSRSFHRLHHSNA